MNGIRRKLRSEKGASITFALLLFLVCAVLSGVIIVAATAASGRLDQIADSDQRYYAVTSAAELLKNELEGRTIIVETVKTVPATISHLANGTEVETTDSTATTKVVSMWYDEGDSDEGDSAEGDSDEKPEDVNVLADANDIAALSLLEDVAYRVADAEYVKLQTVPSGGSAEHLVVAPTDLNKGRALAIGVTDAAAVADSTIADVFSVDMWEEAVHNDIPTLDKGILTLYVSKKDASDATEKKAYTLKLSFKADVKTTVDAKSSVGTPTVVEVTEEGTTYNIPKTTVTTTVTKMTWSLTGIVKEAVSTST